MKALYLTALAGVRRLLLPLLLCCGLAACDDHVNISVPVDVTQAGQSVSVDFDVIASGGYQFCLLFYTGEELEEMNRRFELYGRIYKPGVATPVALRLIKDGRIFMDKQFNAVGSQGTMSAHYNGVNINSAIRNIISPWLPAGHYSARLTVLEARPQFAGIETYFHVSNYDPKI
ncbi:hypothetical protein BTJ39_00790 [Izhakiella australiensis]|uniref:DUF5625 domain-containing protein n=1 Tax=Izhakiella australiensis TaxID=1926881 RepID=A0A1S8YSB2_9GAMM|nr:DUF5625 family protein [Izhakiella australiensis]OON41738.1 hypothetical protein BTJ39_00790 [Izhakiella australiensis]